MTEAEPTPQPVGVHQIAQPSDLVGKTTLSDVHHRDCFVVDIGASVSDRSAEEWARAIFEHAPAPTRDRLTAGWPLLGLQLGPLTSDRHVLGWTIASNSPDEVLLSADGSSGIAAELLVERQRDTLRFASFIALTSPAAHEVWAEVGPRHERTVRQLLAEMLDRTGR